MNNIHTIGLEQEFFFVQALNQNVVRLPDPLRPYADGCGYLLEARGECHADPECARALLAVAVSRLTNEASKYGIDIVNQDTKDLPKEYLRLCLRAYGKTASHSFFMGGRVYHHNTPRAGLHVHFGARYDVDGKGFVDVMNIPRIIGLMDRAFAPEIKATKRVAGEYEMKPYGFEYRSLPATVSLDKVSATLRAIMADNGDLSSYA